MPEEHRLHLGRIDVLSVADEHIVRPAAVVVVPVGVACEDVLGSIPAVLEHRLVERIILVAAVDGVVPDPKNAFSRILAAALIDQLRFAEAELAAAQRRYAARLYVAPAVNDARQAFRQSVTDEKLHTKSASKAGEEGRRAWLAGDDAKHEQA